MYMELVIPSWSRCAACVNLNNAMGNLVRLLSVLVEA